VQIYQRTAVNTFSAIASATVSVTSGNYSGVATLSTPIAIGPNCELAAVVTAGTLQTPMLMIYIVPA